MGRKQDKLKKVKEGILFVSETVEDLKRRLENSPIEAIEPFVAICDFANLDRRVYFPVLHTKYGRLITDYLTTNALPSLAGKRDESLLIELVRRWENHKYFVWVLSRFFYCLDVSFIYGARLPHLIELGRSLFRQEVYGAIGTQIKDAIAALIKTEREGGQIDRTLLKKVINIYVEIEMGQMKFYNDGFERAILDDTAAYYSEKEPIWVSEHTHSAYLMKVEDCKNEEKERVANYLRATSEQKLLETVEHALLSSLLEKENPGSHPLLKDDKTVEPALLSSSIKLALLEKENPGSRPLLKDGKDKLLMVKEGIRFVSETVEELKRRLENSPIEAVEPFDVETNMRAYTAIFDFSNLSGGSYCHVLHAKYGRLITDYLTTNALPSLAGKRDEALLIELVRRWENHKYFVRVLSRFFYCLEVCFISVAQLPHLIELGRSLFRQEVYGAIGTQIKDAIAALIKTEREGGQIDRTLLKKVINIYVEIEMGQMEFYNDGFERAMLEDTAAYYSDKAPIWVSDHTQTTQSSLESYLMKVVDCKNEEKERVANYLPATSEKKLLETVERALLSYEIILPMAKKENPRSRPLLKDGKV